MESIDIFVGGPMGRRVQDGQGLKYEDHTKNAVEAIEIVIDELSDDARTMNKMFHILNPTLQGVGDINARVLGMIDRAEVGAFVLSCTSPSTMYELTLMHALGKPALPIAFKDEVIEQLRTEGVPDLQNLPFYLRTQYALLVDDFQVDTLVGAIRDKLRVLSGIVAHEADPATNPITNFYSLPLLDVSATTGLAAGYFNNFLQYQLKPRSKIFALRPDLKKFIVLYPDRLDDVGGMLDTLKAEATKKGLTIQRIREKDGTPVKDGEQVRGEFVLDVIGSYVVDIPAPLNAQKFSPRYAKLIREEGNADSDLKREDIRLRKTKLEKAMIDRFFAALRGMSSREDFVSTRLQFWSIKRLMSEFPEASADGQ